MAVVVPIIWSCIGKQRQFRCRNWNRSIGVGRQDLRPAGFVLSVPAAPLHIRNKTSE